LITWQTGFPELSSWGAKYSRNTITHYNSERGQSKDYTGYQSTSTTVERTHWGLYSARVQVERTPCGLHSVSVHEYNIHENTLRTTQCTLPWEQQPRGHREYYIVYPSRSTTAERTSWILHSVSIQEYNSREDYACSVPVDGHHKYNNYHHY
jgi:hypothetical protein